MKKLAWLGGGVGLAMFIADLKEVAMSSACCGWKPTCGAAREMGWTMYGDWVEVMRGEGECCIMCCWNVAVGAGDLDIGEPYIVFGEV